VPFQLTFVAREESGIVHVNAEGEATTNDFSSWKVNPLETLLGAEWCLARVLIDFQHVPYIDSSAIGWLISTQKQMRGSGGKLVLHSVPEHVRQILNMLKIGRVVPIVEDVSEGRALLLEAPTATG